MNSQSRIIRGIPAWLMGEYLQELGAAAEGNGRYTHTEWSATVEQIDDYQIGSLRVGQIELIVYAPPARIEQFQTQLFPKLLRGGG